MKTIVCLRVNRIHRTEGSIVFHYCFLSIWFTLLPWSVFQLMGSDCSREHQQSWGRMSLCIDWSGPPHAYANVKAHEAARQHGSCIIALKWEETWISCKRRRKTTWRTIQTLWDGRELWKNKVALFTVQNQHVTAIQQNTLTGLNWPLSNKTSQTSTLTTWVHSPT